jgi:hypothetical protein
MEVGLYVPDITEKGLKGFCDIIFGREGMDPDVVLDMVDYTQEPFDTAKTFVLNGSEDIGACYR